MSSIDTKFLLRSITILLLFQAVFLQSYSQSGTIDFSTTDNTNLGAVANDGEGGSTDIGGVQYDIILINDAGTGTGGDVIYDNSGAGFEGISFSSTPGSGAGFDGISLSTNDGSEFDFNGFSAAEYGFVATTLTVQGFKDGSSTGSTTVSLGAFAVTTYASSDFSDAIFGDVDEVRILGDFGGGNWFGALDAFVLANPITSNTAPTASSFTATNGPFEDLTYTFSTADFGYMDGDGDPLNNLLIEAIPAAGTLYVDADGGDDFDAGEQLSNGSTVSLANLNAGNLQYIQNGSTNTSFQFEVNDGTENSSGNFVATLNVTPIPTVTLAVSPTSRFESITTPANVTTTLSNTYGANVTVNLSFSGTATGGGVDYTLGSSSIIVNAGATSNSTTITNVNDALFEGNETVIVDITGVTNGTESGAQQVTYTISDDETPPNVVFELLSIYDPTSENGGVAFITAELDAASGVTTTVPVSFSGTATQGVDYSVSSSNIVIAAGDTKDSVSITGINDAMVEGDESITIDMGAPTNGVELGVQQVSLTLSDDDNISASVNDPSVSEGDAGTATLQFTVSLSAPALAGGATVDYATSNGSATAGSDYTAVGTTTLSFLAGESSKTVDITTTGDEIVEIDETLTLTLSNPTGTGIIISDATGTGTITNDDQATVTIANVSGNEDDGAITLTLTVDNAVDGGFDVDVSTADGTATTADGDYTAVTSQTLTFAGNTGEMETFTVTPTADATLESDETVLVSMDNVVAGTVSIGDIDVSDGATLTILNDDDISVSVNDPSVAEGDAGTTTLQFTVSLDAPAPAGGATVDYSTSNGTATAGSDYTGIGTTTLAFSVGETSRTVDIDITGDETVETDETLTLNLSNPTGTDVVISDATGTGTITNDDQAIVTIADVAVNENSGTATITVAVDNAVDGGFAVNVSTADGTATTGDSDYTGVSAQTLTFAGTVGESETFNVTLGGDTKVEADETVSISMSSLSPVTVATGDIDITDAATLTLINDDQATLTVADVSGNEDDGAITLTVTVDNAVDGGFDVDVSTADGTATIANSDYTAVTSQTLTFSGTSGEMETFTVTPTADATSELNETVLISMDNTTAGTVSTGDIDASDGAILTILNDDDISISVNDPSIAEGDAGTATLQFTVSLNAPAPAGGATVDYSTSDGTAAAGSDYTGVATTTLTFLAGQTSRTVDITVLGDETVEVDETLTLNLTNPTGTDVVISDAAGLGTITNNDQAIVTIADVAVNENSGTATITVSVDNAVDGGFDVNVSTADGTAATGDSDYTAVAAQTISFAGTAGESETFSVTLGGDTQVEADETVSISMSGLSPVTVATGDIDITDAATLTLINDDQATLTVADVSGNEDDGAITLTVAVDNAVDGGFTVDVSTADGTATTADSDYTAVTSQTLTFAGTANEMETFTVTPTADATSESDETLAISMSNATAGTVSTGDIDISDGATLTILNDDNISASVNDPSVTEGNAGTTTLQFTVSLNAPAPAGGATVDYVTSDGTATAGSDYTAVGTTTLTFLAGETSKTVDVAVSGDEAVEVDETLTITLSNPTGASVLIGDATGTGTITNDDQATVTIDDVMVNENGGTATITVTVDNAVEGGFNVDVSTADGTATTADSDYTAVVAQTLTFGGTASESETFNITLGADTKVEPDETVLISMSGLNPISVDPGDIDISDGAVLTLTNDDVANLSIVATTQAMEDATDGLFTIISTNQFSTAVTVDITVGGSATEGTDYAAIGTSVVFPANQSTVTIPVDVTADVIAEGNETVIVTMTGTDNGDVSIGATADATITITDDDAAVISIVATTQAMEDAVNGIFTISTTNQFTTDVNITFTVTGTATLGEDFTDFGTTLVFPANTDDITLTVPVLADDEDEADETVIVSLISTDNADVSVAPSSIATVTISDNDNTPVVPAGQNFAIDEDVANNFSVGNLIATDADAGTTFSGWIIESGNDDGIFDLDPASGELTILDRTNLDRESTDFYTISVSVSDGINRSMPENVIINVNDINDEIPVITANQSFMITEGIANTTSVGTIVATDSDVTPAVFQDWMIVGGNTSTDGDSDAPFSIDPSTGEITINDTDDINSSILTFSLEVSVSDGTNTSEIEIVTINVSAINDAPSFTAGADQTVLEDAGLQTVNNWAANISAGPTDEASQTLSFVLDNNNNALFDQQPAVSADGTLTYATAGDAFGSATVTAFVSDDGGTDNGGIDRSPDQTFIIVVTPVNDAPSFTAGPDQEVTSGAMDYTVADWATSVISGPDNEAGQALTFNLTNDNNALFTNQPVVNVDGDLSYSIAAEVSGNATVTISLSDDGGTVNGGEDTSETMQFIITVGKLPQAIRFEPIPDKRVGQDPFTLSAVGGDSGNPIIFTLTSTPTNRIATLDGNTITLLGGVGEVTVTASQEGNDSFEAAEAVTQTFSVLANAAFLPNLFTPNNDGQNDRFIIRGGGGVAAIQFSIIDRSSNVVFESSDYNELTSQGWDGTSGGEEQPPGTYVWVVRGTLDDGSPFLINGRETGIIRLSR